LLQQEGVLPIYFLPALAICHESYPVSSIWETAKYQTINH
jgi:hypothetical protein